MYDSERHVYMSLADINETNHAKDPSLPSDSLPYQFPSTASPTYILQALGAPIPPEILPTTTTPVVEFPAPSFA